MQTSNKGDKITKTPTKRHYKGVGWVKVYKDGSGKVHMRKIGVRNATDKGAGKRKAKRRVPGFVNTTDGAKRVQHHR